MRRTQADGGCAIARILLAEKLLLNIVRLVDAACDELGIGVRGAEAVALASRPESRTLRVSEVVLAELQIHIEDSMELAQ